MSKDLNAVFNDLSADLSTALPEDIDVGVHGGMDGSTAPHAAGGFILQLSIANFNNYSNEDISELTNEIMATEIGRAHV